MKIWIDFTNTPHVHFFKPIINHLKKNHELFFTSRNFAETEKLLKMNGILASSYGKHYGNNKVMKALGLFLRDISILRNLADFDLSISAGGENTTHVSLFRDKPSICFGDNDLSLRPIEAKLCDYYFTPSCISQNKLVNFGLDKSKIVQYHGFKENIYLSEYIPDKTFLNSIPFDDFITIRGENLKAAYVTSDTRSILPYLFKIFSQKNILFLPRYDYELKLVKNFPNIFIPSNPLNGLDVCYYSKSVLTGAGTLAREAAILGTPAVSFYAGQKLLKVDRELIKSGFIYHSRDPLLIYQYLQKTSKREFDSSKSKEIKKSVLDKIDFILKNI